MVFEFFGKSYDPRQDTKAESYFQKMKKWISGATSAAKQQLKGILEGSRYSNCLVEGQTYTNIDNQRNRLIMEAWEGKGETMSYLDKEVEEAFVKPYLRPEGSAGSKTMTEQEIDKALNITRKGKKDSSINEAISEAFL